jgi:hypothetical protein
MQCIGGATLSQLPRLFIEFNHNPLSLRDSTRRLGASSAIHVCRSAATGSNVLGEASVTMRR